MDYNNQDSCNKGMNSVFMGSSHKPVQKKHSYYRQEQAECFPSVFGTGVAFEMYSSVGNSKGCGLQYLMSMLKGTRQEKGTGGGKILNSNIAKNRMLNKKTD